MYVCNINNVEDRKTAQFVKPLQQQKQRKATNKWGLDEWNSLE